MRRKIEGHDSCVLSSSLHLKGMLPAAAHVFTLPLSSSAHITLAAAHSFQAFSAARATFPLFLLEFVEGHELGCGLAEEMPPELRQLLARLGERTIAHLGDVRGIVQGVAALWRLLVDPPYRLALMDIARDDLRDADRAVRLAGHEQPCHRCRHRQLASQSGKLSGLV